MNHSSISTSSPVFTPYNLRARCATCSMQNICLPTGLDETEKMRLDDIIGRRSRRISRGGNLYRMNDSFKNLYAVHLGHFKTYQVNAGGEQQITGFQMAGELLGMDAISTDQYQCNAVALEDSDVCEIPFSRLEELFGHLPTLLHHFHRMMSEEITREQSAMLLLGNMRAEQRLATFLINLSARYAARGYSPTSFQLRMSREDIANYLGLTIETISRSLAQFKKNDWLKANNREVQLIDMKSMKALATSTDSFN